MDTAKDLCKHAIRMLNTQGMHPYTRIGRHLLVIFLLKAVALAVIYMLFFRHGGDPAAWMVIEHFRG